MEHIKNNTIIPKEMNLTDTRWRKDTNSVLHRFQEGDLYRNSQITIGRAEEHCQYLDSLLLVDFSNTVTKKERLRHENNWALDIVGKGPKPGPLKKREDYPQAVHRVLVVRSLPDPEMSPNKTNDSDSDQSKNVQERKRNKSQNGNQWGWKKGQDFLLLLLLQRLGDLPPLTHQLGGRHKSGRNDN